MAEITRDRCVAEVDAMMEKILTADTLRADMGEEFFVEAVQAALDHPCAFHEIEVGELHAELAEVHRSLGRHDDLGTRTVTFTPPETCDHCGWSLADEPMTRISLWDLRGLRAALRGSDGPQPAQSTKVGHNETCPCASGQKYKHCHGR